MLRRLLSVIIFLFAACSLMLLSPMEFFPENYPSIHIPLAYGAPGGKGPSGGEFVRLFDKNGDEKISRIEFPRPVEEFDRLDKNNNGFIETDEAPKGPPGGGSKKGGPPGKGMPGMNFIRKYDMTGDDKVSKREYPRPSKEFKGLDKNNDGFIDINEAPFIPPEDGPPRFRRKGKKK
ncbi:hypothetical protein ACFLZT_04450 [Thermodesulfobacteriota bacterium]